MQYFTQFRHLSLKSAMRVICIKTKGEQVKMRRNLAHWGSWDTVGVLVSIPSLRLDLCDKNNLRIN